MFASFGGGTIYLTSDGYQIVVLLINKKIRTRLSAVEKIELKISIEAIRIDICRVYMPH